MSDVGFMCTSKCFLREATRTDTGTFSPVGQSVSEEKQLEQTQGHSHLLVKVSLRRSN